MSPRYRVREGRSVQLDTGVLIGAGVEFSPTSTELARFEPDLERVAEASASEANPDTATPAAPEVLEEPEDAEP